MGPNTLLARCSQSAIRSIQHETKSDDRNSASSSSLGVSSVRGNRVRASEAFPIAQVDSILPAERHFAIAIPISRSVRQLGPPGLGFRRDYLGVFR